MSIIKINATASTNQYLKDLAATIPLDDMSLVVTDEQTKGRGQRDSEWSSEKGKNLTFSILKKDFFLQTHQQFVLNMVVSLAIIKTLNQYKIPNISIKWPNDILSEDFKICGILIENVIRNTQIESSIIGIGLNVNQTYFSNLPHASSLKSIMGSSYDIEELMSKIVQQFEVHFQILTNGNVEELKTSYMNELYKKDQWSKFSDASGEVFSAMITGVNQWGQLVIKTESGSKTYDPKTIKMVY